MFGNLKIVKGRVVKATAGRDSDKFFVVTDFDGKFAKIADGKSRKLTKPKLKSLKHLQVTNTVIDMENLTDKMLKNVLAVFSKENTAFETQEEDFNV